MLNRKPVTRISTFLAVVLFFAVYSGCSKNPNKYTDNGVEKSQQGKYDEAIAEFNKAIAANPEDARAYYCRSVAYFFKKDYDKSWEEVYKAKSLGYKIEPDFLNNLKKASGKK
jgi:tetratricopeptide (TPR) repeat protein